MVREDADRLFYASAGMIAAVLLGGALTWLRELTSAANLAFPFLVLTIVAAEYGGSWAAVATALASSTSVDFFLTKPYLTLTMASKHDIITFTGLTICGLVVATFGSVRGRAIARMRRDRARLDLLRELVGDLAAGCPSDPSLSRSLERARTVLPLTAAVVRRERDEVVAASDRAFGLPAPSHHASFESLEHLPAEGVSLPLEVGRRRVGSLDLWGRGAPVDDEARRTLADIGRIAGLMLER